MEEEQLEYNSSCLIIRLLSKVSVFRIAQLCFGAYQHGKSKNGPNLRHSINDFNIPITNYGPEPEFHTDSLQQNAEKTTKQTHLQPEERESVGNRVKSRIPVRINVGSNETRCISRCKAGNILGPECINERFDCIDRRLERIEGALLSIKGLTE